jgi:hypothetical protein
MLTSARPSIRSSKRRLTPPWTTSISTGDKDIPITPPLSPTPFDDEDVAAKKYNEIRIGSIIRAHAKLLEQQVNSLLIEPDLLFSENFILPKSMHLCMIRFVDNMSIA